MSGRDSSEHTTRNCCCCRVPVDVAIVQVDVVVIASTVVGRRPGVVQRPA